MSASTIPAIGIDLGTTFSGVCYMKGGVATMIQNKAGLEITPSVVHIEKDKPPLVGEEAVKKRKNQTKNNISKIKRLIGRKHNCESVQIQRWEFQIVCGRNRRAAVKIDDRVFTPEEISAMILQYMKSIAKNVLEGEPTDAVITVPANFTNAQREATKNAGKLAGLNVLQIINEPTAAAIAFSEKDDNKKARRRVLVFDLGGGTFDVSIVEMVGHQTKVLASGGKTTLGGADIDERIYEEAIIRFQDMGFKINGVDWLLFDACEKAKKALSKLDSARISHKRFEGASFDLTYSLFLELCLHHLEETMRITDEILQKAGMDESHIDEILLVGGSTRIKYIREQISKRFPNTKIRGQDEIEPELAVAKGAAILADYLSKGTTLSESPILFDVAPFQLGLRVDGNKCKMPGAIGIDLGTTYSVVAVMQSDTLVEVLENNHCNKITPSVVHFGSHFKAVGEEAQEKREADQLNTVFQNKRFMGRNANDHEIIKRSYPFEIISSGNGQACIRVTPLGGSASHTYSPEQISSFILKQMKEIAEKKIGPVTDAVITVPANFNNEQKQATIDAGEMAGLNVLRIINEPTAAAIAYGLGRDSEKEKIVLVYDLGGGTFDVSIVRSKGLVGEVLATSGLTDLGGEDFDHAIFQYAVIELQENDGVIVADNDYGLYRSCEEAKVTLSTSDEATIELYRDGRCYECEITREVFEDLCMNLFERTIKCVEDAISESGVDKQSIDDVVLVGGSSQIPKVRQMVRDFFGDKELKFNIPPDHAVACGAAILAASLSSNPSATVSSFQGAVKMSDVLPFSLGTSITCGRTSVIQSKHFTNASDSESGIADFRVMEGENALNKDNKYLGKCAFAFPKLNVGQLNLTATFSVDDNGILSVHLKDERFGVEAKTTVQTVLLQSDVVAQLEERRELSLSGLIVSFQQACRRHLAQRWLAKRRLLETAIRCIQKNGQSYCAVRKWPWWRLYARVVPLLAVTRSDAETREWDERIRALERQIGELKQNKSRLEGRVCELEEEVTRGVAQAHEMSVALEREGQARIVAERRLQGSFASPQPIDTRASLLADIEARPPLRPVATRALRVGITEILRTEMNSWDTFFNGDDASEADDTRSETWNE